MLLRHSYKQAAQTPAHGDAGGEGGTRERGNSPGLEQFPRAPCPPSPRSRRLVREAGCAGGNWDGTGKVVGKGRSWPGVRGVMPAAARLELKEASLA